MSFPGKIKILVFLASLLLTITCFAQDSASYDKRAVALLHQAVTSPPLPPDSALRLLAAAIEIDSNYYMAYLNMASFYLQKREYKNAIAALQKSLEKKPDQAEAVVMLGMIYDYTGVTTKAKEQYQAAIHLFDLRLLQSPKNHANLVNRAFALLFLNHPGGADEVRRLDKTFPGDYAVQMLKDFNKEQYLEAIFKRENE